MNHAPKDQIDQDVVMPAQQLNTQEASEEAGQTYSSPHKRPFHLVRWYALLSLITIIATSSISATILSQFIAERILYHDALVTQQFIQAATESVKTNNTPEDFNGIGDEKWLEDYLTRITNLPDMPLIKIYSPEQKIVWSTDSKLIGEQFTDNPQLIKALQGELMYGAEEIHELNSENDKTDLDYFSKELDQVVEVYVPLWNPSHTATIGVVEVYRVPSLINQTTKAGTLLIWFALLMSGLFLYIVLFSLIRRANTVMNKQRQAIAETEAMATIGEMTSAMAHGIRNPLASIRSSAELLQLNPELAPSMTENIIQATDKLDKWTEEFIQFAETEHKLNAQLICFDMLLSECIDLIRHQPGTERIEFIQLPFETYAPIVGDSPLLRQLMNIVLNNAVEAMPDGGMLTVSVEREDDIHLKLIIRDTGVGIPKDQLRHVFKPFITTKKHALGLGLMLARRIADHHNGHIHISSHEQVGTTVSITLPVVSMQRMKVLIIDDEGPLNQNLHRYLEQYEFDIQCAATAKEGLEINQSWLPHLVLTEVKLRDMSGVGLIERLATSKNAPLIYVMTGQGNLQRDENGVLSHIDARIVQAGASGFLSKPMPLSEIRIQLETAKLKALPARQRNITLSQ